jgi:cytoskeletal protein CcmA (bactofilin family)
MSNTQQTVSEDTASNGEHTPSQATIGKSVKIHGDLSGKEDLVINGTVEGTVDFRENNVTVGEGGKVNANITARNIIIKGEVKGEMRGSEQVTINPSGRVTGDIRAPRVVLNDGCQFKGLVDMEDKPHAGGEGRVGAKPVGPRPFPERPLPGSGQATKPVLGRRKL